MACFIAPAPLDILNDLFLGLSVVALGLVIWLVILLVKDPKGVVKAALKADGKALWGKESCRQRGENCRQSGAYTM